MHRCPSVRYFDLRYSALFVAIVGSLPEVIEQILLEIQDRNDFWNGNVRSPTNPLLNEAIRVGENRETFF